ncbi:sphX [Symbiodinium natans]|uniref:SphX protein n=1 Tax=Symbiodinium natans TaxID=878477 RepID=A0A812UGQ0_9DINO|nr:sphX [Symbiodinium natans]
MSKTALMPFMCYRHPNGRASVLRFSDVLCWESSDHTLMVVFGIFMTASMALYWSILVCCTLLAPRLSSQGNVFFLTATRFLFFRFRTDCWWYGTWFIMRGPLLSLPVAIFTDLPQVQLFCMTAVIETYMVIQLVVWPWKTPLINLADGSMNMMMILLLSLGTTFLDALEGDARMTYSRIAVGILGVLYFVAFLLLCAALYALCHKVSMGSSEEHWVLTLGRPPSTTQLCEAFEALQIAYQTVDSAVIEKAIDDLSVYDRRMLAAVLTTVAPMLGNDRRMKLARRLSVTTTSLASMSVRSQGAAEAERASSPQPQKVESTEVPPSAHIRREVAQSAYI